MAVLITGAATAGAHRLQRALGLTDVVFADHQDLPSALFRHTKFVQIPAGDAFSFAHQILTLCLDHAIDMVFPLRRDEVLPLAEAKKLFEEYNIDILVPQTAKLPELLVSASSLGEEIVVVRDGMVLSGQFLDENEIPCETGLFVCPSDNYSELKLFIVD